MDMWIDNDIFREDLEYIINTKYVSWEKFANKTFFITGGTGLIGFYVINSLLYYSQVNQSDIHIIALVRDIDKANEMYKEQLQISKSLSFFVGDLEDLPEIDVPINYIIHGASPTASIYFLEYPVETIKTAVLGTMNILEMAKEKAIDSMVYLSSMEIYGVNFDSEKISEDHQCNLNTMNARNSYPESKRLCENLCSSYYAEYGIPVNSLRLTQTFGPGIKSDDKRIFAAFIHSHLKNQDIDLLTEGRTCRSYLYLADAVTAILTVLSSEVKNQAFNVANEETYCSIRDMADLVANKISCGHINVNINLGTQNSVQKFMPELYMNLSSEKLKKLGWTAKFNLVDMYKRTIQSMKK